MLIYININKVHSILVTIACVGKVDVKKKDQKKKNC